MRRSKDMASEGCRIVLEGKVKEGYRFSEVVSRLSTLFSKDPDTVRRLFRGKSVVIKRHIDRGTADRYKDALDKLGAVCHVEVEPTGDDSAADKTEYQLDLPEQSVEPCPKCGHPLTEQDKKAQPAECPSCGVIIEKYLDLQKRREAQSSLQPTAYTVDTDSAKTSKTLTQIGAAILVFAAVCFITGIVFSTSRKVEYHHSLTPDGGIAGPISVREGRGVYKVEIGQTISKDNDWSYVSGDVLDQDRNYLFGFGEEFWKESGRDIEGRWSERNTSFDYKIALQKGTYYLSLESERSPGVVSPVVVKISRVIGSYQPMAVAGIIGLILGGILIYMENYKAINRWLAENAD